MDVPFIISCVTALCTVRDGTKPLCVDVKLPFLSRDTGLNLTKYLDIESFLIYHVSSRIFSRNIGHL